MIKFALILGLMATTATAQQTLCGPNATMLEYLRAEYGETVQLTTPRADGAIIEVFANLETGTWSILVTEPGGLTCMKFYGADYEPILEGELS